MTVIVRSGGACWNVAAFVASRVAALQLAPNCEAQAAAELVAVCWALAVLEQDGAGEVAA